VFAWYNNIKFHVKYIW